MLESPVPQKRGPKTLISDDELLTIIRDDLAASLFIGEGHRKVWGRIRFVKEIKVGRKRVLRIMRQNNLLSPHRVRGEVFRVPFCLCHRASYAKSHAGKRGLGGNDRDNSD